MEPLEFGVCSVQRVSRSCCENVAVGGRWSNLSPSPVWLCFFLSSVLLLLGYRQSDAGNFMIGEMILHQHRKVEMEPAEAERHPPRWPPGEKNGGVLGWR